MLTSVLVETGFVLTVKVAVAPFAETVTLGGTVAAGSLLARVTTAPLLGAAPSSVTVAVAWAPPVTVAGVTDMELTPTGVTARLTVAVFDLSPPVVLTW
jgi:hypothetical protein